MTLEELKTLALRTGLLLKHDYGCLLACDPATEEDSPHARVVVLQAGSLAESWVKFNAHSMCGIRRPATGIVVVSPDGLYAVFSKSVETGNIFQSPLAGGPHYGSIRSVASIDGRAYAVGLRASAFFLDDAGRWTWFGAGLPEDTNLEAIAGFNGHDLFAVGFKGAIWHFDGKVWSREDVPTNVNLTSVVCAPGGSVYAAGHAGMLLRGKHGFWDILVQEKVREDLWALEWFDDTLFVSSLIDVYRLSVKTLEPVDFGDSRPETTYRLTAADGTLWSVGESDVMAYDGSGWRRIV